MIPIILELHLEFIKGEVIRIERGFAGRGVPVAPKIFVVKNDLGKISKVDEDAVLEIDS